MYGTLGDDRKAREHLELARSLARDTGNRFIQTWVHPLALVYWRLGMHEEAFACAEECLAVALESEERLVEPSARNTLGELYRHDGRAEDGLAQHRAALAAGGRSWPSWSTRSPRTAGWCWASSPARSPAAGGPLDRGRRTLPQGAGDRHQEGHPARRGGHDLGARGRAGQGRAGPGGGGLDGVPAHRPGQLATCRLYSNYLAQLTPPLRALGLTDEEPARMHRPLFDPRLRIRFFPFVCTRGRKPLDG